MATNGTILVVDSESMVQMLLQTQLRDAGFSVTLATDIREATRSLSDQRFDVIMVDKNLPDGDGLDFIRTLRSNDPDLETILMTGYGSFESALDAMDAGVFDYLTKPFDQLTVVCQRVQRAVERRSRRRELQTLVDSLGESNRRLTDSMNELKTAYLDTAQVISRILAMRGPPSAEETARIKTLALATADRLSLEDDAKQWLGVAASLRDVGKIGTIEEMVGKPNRLSPEEQDQLREHPDIAARLLAAVSGYRPLARIIRHQNERFDGTGYPDRLAGDSIPLEARILGVANAYVAMTSHRPYRVAKTLEEVRAELRKEAGLQFDPHVVEKFLLVVADQGSVDQDSSREGQEDET